VNCYLGRLGLYGSRLRIRLADVDATLEERTIFNADACRSYIAGEGAFSTDVDAISGSDVALELAKNDDLTGANAGRDIAVFANGDAIAGEANMGTLRLSLTKPVTRTQYMLGKFLASLLYTIALLVFLAILALFGSMLLFGTNDLVIFRSASIHEMSSDDVFWRYVAAFAYATVALTTVSSLAFLLSVFAENAIGPIIATMSIVIVFTILSEMNIPFYDRTIRPYLFTTHMVAWKGFFYLKADDNGQSIKGSIENLPAILRSMTVLLAYIVLFVSSTKEIRGGTFNHPKKIQNTNK